MDMSQTYGNTGSENYDATRELGSVEVSPSGSATSSTTSPAAESQDGGLKEVAKDEAGATLEHFAGPR